MGASEQSPQAPLTHWQVTFPWTQKEFGVKQQLPTPHEAEHTPPVAIVFVQLSQ